MAWITAKKMTFGVLIVLFTIECQTKCWAGAEAENTNAPQETEENTERNEGEYSLQADSTFLKMIKIFKNEMFYVEDLEGQFYTGKIEIIDDGIQVTTPISNELNKVAILEWSQINSIRPILKPTHGTNQGPIKKVLPYIIGVPAGLLALYLFLSYGVFP